MLCRRTWCLCLIINIICCWGAFLMPSIEAAECTGTCAASDRSDQTLESHTQSDRFPAFPIPETTEPSEQEMRMHIVRLEDHSFWMATPKNYTMWSKLEEVRVRLEEFILRGRVEFGRIVLSGIMQLACVHTSMNGCSPHGRITDTRLSIDFMLTVTYDHTRIECAHTHADIHVDTRHPQHTHITTV
jgi:hypothetical protein